MPQGLAAIQRAIRQGQDLRPGADLTAQLVAGLKPGLEAEHDMARALDLLERAANVRLGDLALAGAGLVAIGVGYDLQARRLGYSPQSGRTPSPQ